MGEDPHDKERSGRWPWLFAVVPGLIMLYVLSIGPVVALAEKGALPMGPTKSFYAPVRWLHDHTPLEKPLEWYADLWGWH